MISLYGKAIEATLGQMDRRKTKWRQVQHDRLLKETNNVLRISKLLQNFEISLTYHNKGGFLTSQHKWRRRTLPPENHQSSLYSASSMCGKRGLYEQDWKKHNHLHSHPWQKFSHMITPNCQRNRETWILMGLCRKQLVAPGLSLHQYLWKAIYIVANFKQIFTVELLHYNTACWYLLYIYRLDSILASNTIFQTVGHYPLVDHESI